MFQFVRMQSRRIRVAVAGAAGLVTLSGAAFLYTNDPARHSFYPGCIFHLLTGFSCPGCGATRALYQLLHADIAAAFQLNPLFCLLYLPLIIHLAILNVPAFIRNERFREPRWGTHSGWAAAGLIFAFWIIRNTPLYPYP